MKKMNLFLLGAFLAIFSIVFTGCKKDDVVEFTLVSLTADGIDMNGATAASGVPANVAIEATFSKDVDEADFTATMEQDYDGAVISLNIAVNGKIVTITPSEQGTGALYILSVGAISSTDGDVLPAITRSYSTEGTFVPAGVMAYWPFDGNANDAVGTYNPTANGIVAITYGNDHAGVAGGAAVFDGDQSIIEIPNGDVLLNSANFTISFWVKTNSTGHVNDGGNPTGHWVLGLGAFNGIQFEIFGGYDGAKFAVKYELANGTTAGEDMWFPALATDYSNGGWQGWDYAKSLTADEMIALLKDKWLHVVFTFDGADRKSTLYYNGIKMKSFDFDLWPAEAVQRTVKALIYAGVEPENVNELAFGFIHSRAGTMWDAESWGGYDFPTSQHFKGSLDEVRIFHKTLSAQEIDLMYNSERAK